VHGMLDAVRCALPCNDVCCSPHAARTPCCCTGTFCMLHVDTVRSILHAACCALRRRPLRRLSRPAAAATDAVVCSRHEKRVRACALPCGVGWTGMPCCRPTSSVRAAKHMRTHAACACAAAAEAEGVTEQGRTRHVYSPVIRATDIGCTEGPNDTGEYWKEAVGPGCVAGLPIAGRAVRAAEWAGCLWKRNSSIRCRCRHRAGLAWTLRAARCTLHTAHCVLHDVRVVWCMRHVAQSHGSRPTNHRAHRDAQSDLLKAGLPDAGGAMSTRE